MFNKSMKNINLTSTLRNRKILMSYFLLIKLEIKKSGIIKGEET